MALELGCRWRACAGRPEQPRLHLRPLLRRPATTAQPPHCQLDGAGSSSGGGSAGSSGSAGSGERLPLPRKSSKLEPSLYLSPEDAVIAQLKALQHNSFPSSDHGIEVMYRFSAFDPFTRCDYFGRTLDLGQWERFRRIFYTPRFVTLLGHTRHTVLSTLEVAERVWKARVLVVHERRKEEQVYEFTMIQREGGWKDGYWFTLSVIPDAEDVGSTIYGVI